MGKEGVGTNYQVSVLARRPSYRGVRLCCLQSTVSETGTVAVCIALSVRLREMSVSQRVN